MCEHMYNTALRVHQLHTRTQACRQDYLVIVGTTVTVPHTLKVNGSMIRKEHAKLRPELSRCLSLISYRNNSTKNL